MKRRLKWLVVVTICLALLLPGLAACTSEPAQPQTVTQTQVTTQTATKTSVSTVTQTAAPTFSWPRRFNIGAGPIGGSSYIVPNAVAVALEQSTGMICRSFPENESSRLLRMINNEIDLFFMDATEMSLYYYGVSAYADLEKSPVNLFWHLQDPPRGFYTTADSEIETIYDIKRLVEEGKTVRGAVFAPAVALADEVRYLLPAFLGLQPEDLEIVPFSDYGASVSSIVDGKADVCISSPISGIVTEIAGHPRGIRFLEMPLSDTEGWARVLEVKPTAVPGTVTWGREADWGKQTYIMSQMWWVRADMDEEMAYQLAKWIDENYDMYKDTSAGAARQTLELFREYLDSSPYPVHPGVVRYLKEIGQWSAADDAWNADASKLVQQYVDAWAPAVAEAKAKGASIAMDNQEWLDIWNAKIKGIPAFKSRM